MFSDQIMQSNHFHTSITPLKRIYPYSISYREFAVVRVPVCSDVKVSQNSTFYPTYSAREFRTFTERSTNISYQWEALAVIIESLFHPINLHINYGCDCVRRRRSNGRKARSIDTNFGYQLSHTTHIEIVMKLHHQKTRYIHSRNFSCKFLPT